MSDDQSRNPGLPARDGSTDPWLWLEEVTGEDALGWVREHNARAEEELDATAAHGPEAKCPTASA